jgi:hypothetical protein
MTFSKASVIEYKCRKPHFIEIPQNVNKVRNIGRITVKEDDQRHVGLAGNRPAMDRNFIFSIKPDFIVIKSQFSGGKNYLFIGRKNKSSSITTECKKSLDQDNHDKKYLPKCGALSIKVHIMPVTHNFGFVQQVDFDKHNLLTSILG